MATVLSRLNINSRAYILFMSVVEVHPALYWWHTFSKSSFVVAKESKFILSIVSLELRYHP